MCLNLAEGSAKETIKERRRFYGMALASLREVQAIVDLESLNLANEANIVGAHVYKLYRSLG